MSEIINYGKVALTIDGDWDANRTYDRLCIVTYNNLSYVSKTDNVKGTPPPDSYDWELLSVKGDKGAKGDQGSKGLKGDKGDPGLPAVNYRTITIFISNETRPNNPEEGEWNLENDSIILPEGWSTDDELNAPIWMSTGVFSSVNPKNPTWTRPVKITGDKGNNGKDSNTGEFIYCRLEDENKSLPAITNINVDGHVPTGWESSPLGITETYRIEYFAYRKKDSNGDWMDFENPAIWSRWGANGLDGDGVQYIFRRNNGASIKNPIEEFNININSDEYQQIGEFKGSEFIPGNGEWTDNPKGVDITNTYEWCCKRNFKNGKWGAYSNPALWAKYSADGANGTNGDNGISITVRYQKTTGSDDIPKVVKDNKNPGSAWSAIIPHFEVNEALWEIQAYVDYKGDLVQVNTTDGIVFGWCDPILKSGVAGTNGTVPNYNITFYKKSNSIPNQPTFSNLEDAKNSEDWLDYPNDSGQWWQCTALVDGVTEKLTWGNVLQVNGQDGIAQDGKYWETRFAASSNDNAPEINKSNRYASTTNVIWVKVDGNTPPPTVPEGGSLWQTWAEIEPGGTKLVGEWSDPFRISGERGPIGYKGATGEPGPSGTHGISIETLYCLGNENHYIAETAPNGENYAGWTWTVPKVNDDYKYVWCCQGKKIYSDSIGNNFTYQWGAPFRLTGLNGIGEKGIGIESIENYYALSKSAITEPSKTDYEAEGIIPIMNEETPYLWNYEVVKYSDGTSKSTKPQVISVSGINGRNIIEIEEFYYVGPESEGVTIDNYTWSTDLLFPNDKDIYLWNYEEIKFDKGESIKTNPIRIGNYVVGERGPIGKIVYPAGIYNNSITYKTTETTCPYVLDTLYGNYYILNADKWEAWQNLSPGQSYAAEPNKYWTKMDFYESIFAKIGIIDNGIIGSAVFNGDYMFSQQGINNKGVYSTSYEKFNANDPYNSTNEFRPNICINFKTGEIWLSRGKVHTDPNGNVVINGKIITDEGSKIGSWFTWEDGTISTVEEGSSSFPMIKFNPNGSGHLCNKNISWDAAGNLSIGSLKSSGGITPPTVTIGDGAWVTTADGGIKTANNNAYFAPDGSGYIGGLDTKNNPKGVSWQSDGDITIHKKALYKPVFIEVNSEVSETNPPVGLSIDLENSIYIIKNSSVSTLSMTDDLEEETYQCIWLSWFTNEFNLLLNNGETFNCTIINHSDSILSFNINDENFID